MPEKSVRKGALINFVDEKIRRFKAGEIDSIPTLDELSKQFGYPHQTVSVYLVHAGLARERRSIERTGRVTRTITPTRDWAWMLGVLAGGGNVNSVNRTVSLGTTNEPEILGAFSNIGERLFGVNASEKNKWNNQSQYQVAVFYTMIIPALIGDLREDKWLQTVTERHGWIMGTPEYIWGFIEGFYERKGDAYFDRNTRNRSMVFRTCDFPSATFIVESLVKLGIQNPKFIRADKNSDLIRGVRINNLRDIKFVAENIHSKIPTKERMLDFYRKFEQVRFPARRSRVESPEEVINEWRKIMEMLGHTPNSGEIDDFYHDGKAKYSKDVYASRFGNRSYKKAATTLEDIIFTQDINRTLQESGIRVKYHPKVHRLPEDEAKERLKKILEDLSVPRVFPGVLIGLDGNPLQKREKSSLE